MRGPLSAQPFLGSRLLCLLLLLYLGPLTICVTGARVMACVCTTADCQARGVRTCSTSARCYSQHLDRHDGSHPVTRGCISHGRRNSLLCMNQRPSVRLQEWPMLLCCDTPLCNRDTTPTPPTPSTTEGALTPEAETWPPTTDALERLGVANLEEFHRKFGIGRGGRENPSPQMHIVFLIIIGAAVAFMVAVSAMGTLLLVHYRTAYVRAPTRPTAPMLNRNVLLQKAAPNTTPLMA